jgi:wobble nucleotide-excising tRNase
LPTPKSRETTDVSIKLEYVFIDDPVSSLDENHLIELAVNLAGLIKSSQSGSQVHHHNAQPAVL